MESPHASALQVKHAGLERALQLEQGRPAPNPAAIKELKQQKLRIKDALSHR